MVWSNNASSFLVCVFCLVNMHHAWSLYCAVLTFIPLLLSLCFDFHSTNLQTFIYMVNNELYDT